MLKNIIQEKIQKFLSYKNNYFFKADPLQDLEGTEYTLDFLIEDYSETEKNMAIEIKNDFLNIFKNRKQKQEEFIQFFNKNQNKFIINKEKIFTILKQKPNSNIKPNLNIKTMEMEIKELIEQYNYPLFHIYLNLFINKNNKFNKYYLYV